MGIGRKPVHHHNLLVVDPESYNNNDDDGGDEGWGPYTEEQILAFMNALCDDELSDREIDRFLRRLSEEKQEELAGAIRKRTEEENAEFDRAAKRIEEQQKEIREMFRELKREMDESLASFFTMKHTVTEGSKRRNRTFNGMSRQQEEPLNEAFFDSL